MSSSIRFKLIKSNILIFSCVFILCIITVSLISFYNNKKNLQNTQIQIRNALIAKGQTLVKNNSIALRGMVSDNAYSDVKELVTFTIRNDQDIVYGIYMESDRKPWVIAKKDLIDNQNSNYTPLEDSASVWASKQTKAIYHSIHLNGDEVIEFTAPVIVEDKIHGFILYGLTTKSMSILLEKAHTDANQAFLQILSALIAMTLVAITLAFIATHLQAGRITSPIQSLVKSAQLIAGGDYSNDIRSETDDEIGVLSSTFETMRKTVKQYTEHLQDLVDEKMKQVHDIMNNIDQGLFTINLDLSVNPEYSIRANQILGFEDIAKESFKILFRLDHDGVKMMNEWIKLVIERHNKMKWSKLARLAPVQEFEMTSGNDSKYVRISYQKITEKDGSLSKIMILAQDITESRRIENLMKDEKIRHENEVKTILGIVSNPPEIITDFLSDTEHRLTKDLPQIEQMLNLTSRQRDEYPDGFKIDFIPDEITSLFRDFHTIKGNAGSYGFEMLANQAHGAESSLENLKEPVTLRRSDLLSQLFKTVSDMLITLSNIKNTAKKLSGDQDEMQHIALSKIDHIQNLCQNFNRDKRDTSITELVNACKCINYKTVSQLAKKYKDLVTRVSEKLGKEVIFEIVNPSYEVHPKSFEDFDEALIHIIRNSLDHGIEFPSERCALGKDTGRISFHFRTTDEGREITVNDDGRGIDVEKLVSKAIEKGIITPETALKMTDNEKLHLIFMEGLSTLDQISSISGRGVGMNIVEKVIENLHGHISVRSYLGKSTTFSIIIPYLS